jgi:hypothetical protein
MLYIYDKNNIARVIRPCPLISISFTQNRNKMGTFGGTYDIVLTGTILENEGSPSISGIVENSNTFSIPNPAKFANTYNPRPISQIIPTDDKMGAIFYKQHALRELFAIDGQRFELFPITGNEPVITFYPTLQSINFEEGIYLDTCKYTVNLKADMLLDRDDKVIIDGAMCLNFEPSGYYAIPTLGHFHPTDTANDPPRRTIEDYILEMGGFIDDFSENWAIELDDTNGNTSVPVVGNNNNVTRAYRLTRNISATGKTVYVPDSGRYEAWHQARGFIQKRLLSSGSGIYLAYPNLSQSHLFASGFINLSDSVFGGYNHARTESIDKSAGTYSISDTWLLSSGTSYENYNLSFSSAIDSSENTVNIQGSIKGLSSIPASGNIFGGNYASSTDNTPYNNAALKYNVITNSGNFGYYCPLFQRINNISSLDFNPQPKSITVGANEFTGEITYDVAFDTRPCNVVSGTTLEIININDTYPGDIFAIIPVLGRSTGPVLQYLGSRTEYRRDVTIELIFSPRTLPCSGDTISTIAGNRDKFMFSKPSLYEPSRSQINTLINSLSPAYEYGIRKYFINPPTESWSPRDRRYTLNLSWIYELDH